MSIIQYLWQKVTVQVNKQGVIHGNERTVGRDLAEFN